MTEHFTSGSDRTTIPVQNFIELDRLAGLGWMIGDIMHGVNNFLTIIMASVDMILLNEKSEPFEDGLERVINNCEKGNTLTQSTQMAFSSLTKAGVSPPFQVIDALLTIVTQVYRHKMINVIKETPEDCPPVKRSIEFTQAAYHAIQACFQTVEGKETRDVGCVLSNRNSTVDLTFTVSEGKLTLPPDDHQVPVFDDPAYHLWMIDQLSKDGCEWHIDNDGRRLSIIWQVLNDSE